MFTIPVNLAARVANEIVDTGRVVHSYVGVQAEPLPASTGARLGYDGGGTQATAMITLAARP